MNLTHNDLRRHVDDSIRIPLEGRGWEELTRLKPEAGTMWANSTGGGGALLLDYTLDRDGDWDWTATVAIHVQVWSAGRWMDLIEADVQLAERLIDSGLSELSATVEDLCKLAAAVA